MLVYVFGAGSQRRLDILPGLSNRPNAQTRGGIRHPMLYYCLVMPLPMRSQKGTCHLQRMVSFILCVTVNYGKCSAHQMG